MSDTFQKELVLHAKLKGGILKGKGVGINSCFGYALIDAGDINLDGYNGMYCYLNLLHWQMSCPVRFVNSDTARKHACLTLSCIMLKNSQTYGVKTPQDFKSMFGHFSTFCMKELVKIKSIYKRFQQTNTCSKLIIETLKKVWNMS